MCAKSRKGSAPQLRSTALASELLRRATENKRVRNQQQENTAIDTKRNLEADSSQPSSGAPPMQTDPQPSWRATNFVWQRIANRDFWYATTRTTFSTTLRKPEVDYCTFVRQLIASRDFWYATSPGLHFHEPAACVRFSALVLVRIHEKSAIAIAHRQRARGQTLQT